MTSRRDHPPHSDRREFLCRLSAAVVTGVISKAASPASAAEETASPPLPSIPLGPHRVSRLVAGWNPIGGYSYMGHHTDAHMREYFTVERTVEFLLNCERHGINTHQYSPSDKMPKVLQTLRERGSKMQLICLHSGRANVQPAIEADHPIAMVHHGGATDSLFAQGKSGEVHDFVKAAHDGGVLAGVSAHNPDCIRRVADEGWEVDFFMTCFYFLTRKKTAGAADKTPLTPTLDIGYPFFRDDPLAMTEVVRQVKQPCFGFKILAAGRKCHDERTVREAFKFAFTHIKPGDGVIVGMYPRFFDEVSANAQYAREFGKPA